MNKRIIILLAVLVLSFSLFSCRKDEADQVVDSVINVASALGNSELGKLVSSDISALRISVGVDDLDGVKKYAKKFGVNTSSIPDISDADADLYIDFKNAKLAQTVNAVVAGDDVDFAAYEDVTNVVFTSNLVDKTYGADTQSVVGWVSDDAGAYEQVCKYAAFSTRMFGTYGKVANNFIDNQMKDILRKNVEFENEKKGKNLIITCTLTEKELDAICEELAGKQKPNNTSAFASLADVFNNADVGVNCEFVIVEKTSELLGMTFDISSNGEKTGTVKYSYDPGKASFEFSLVSADNDTSVVLTGNLNEKSGGEYELVMLDSYKQGDATSSTEIVISVVASNGILDMEYEYEYDYKSKTRGNDHEKQKLSLEASYVLTETTMTLKVLEIGYGDFITIPNIDELVGITIEIEKNPKIPTAPAKYENLRNPTELKTKVFYQMRDNLDKSAQPLFNRLINMFFI